MVVCRVTIRKMKKNVENGHCHYNVFYVDIPNFRRLCIKSNEKSIYWRELKIIVSINIL